MIFQWAYRPETADINYGLIARDWSLHFAEVDVRQVREPFFGDDWPKSVERLLRVSKYLHTKSRAANNPVHGDTFDCEKGHVRMKVNAPLDLRMQPLQHGKFFWNHPEGFNHHDIGVMLADGAVNVIVVLDFDNIRPNIFFAQRPNDEACRVKKPARPAGVNSQLRAIDFVFLTNEQNFHWGPPCLKGLHFEGVHANPERSRP